MAHDQSHGIRRLPRSTAYRHGGGGELTVTVGDEEDRVSCRGPRRRRHRRRCCCSSHGIVDTLLRVLVVLHALVQIRQQNVSRTHR